MVLEQAQHWVPMVCFTWSTRGVSSSHTVEDPEGDLEEVKGSPQVEIRRKSVEREVNQHRAVQGHVFAQSQREDIFQYCLLPTYCSSPKEQVHHLFSPLGGIPGISGCLENSLVVLSLIRLKKGRRPGCNMA